MIKQYRTTIKEYYNNMDSLQDLANILIDLEQQKYSFSTISTSLQKTTEAQNKQSQPNFLLKYKLLRIRPDCPKQLLFNLQKLFKQNYKLEHVVSKRWVQYKMPELCPYIVQWHHDDILQLYANHYPYMYQQMKDIKFYNLKYMNTWGNNIQSIQCISRMYMPNLQQICLWDNKLTNLHPFRRIFAPNLTWIDIKTNLILDHSPLSQLYTASKKYTRIHVTVYGSPSALYKIQGQKFSDIIINCKISCKFEKVQKDRGFG